MSFCLQITALLLALVYVAHGQGSGLSEEEQEEILNAHNYYRRIVDPIATNMLKMVSHMTTSPSVVHDALPMHRNGMKNWPTWHSFGHQLAGIWRMKTDILNLQSLTM